jgi:erythronate-4-phosphate dehydrogenase
MRILVDENIPQGLPAFSAYGDARTFSGRSLRRGDLLQADALLVRSITRVDEALLGGTPVRFVGTATIGTDHVDREFLRQAGIGFASAPGCNARSVAEYLVSALLHLHVRKNLPLEGKTLGIVGYGHVGSEAARLAQALGLRILRCDPPLAEKGNQEKFLPLSELVKQCDIISLHVPLTSTGPYATSKMANNGFFEGFEASKTLINTARGEVVDESALLQGLDRGAIGNLVLDVFPGEPDFNPVLARADLITPHVAGYSVQGKLNGTQMVRNAFCRHFGLKKADFPDSAPTLRPAIPFPGSGGNLYSYLHYFVTKSYDISRDDAELRQVLNQGGLALGFDSLRRHYPERHEFSTFRAVGVPSTEFTLRARLTALGFFVE